MAMINDVSDVRGTAVTAVCGNQEPSETLNDPGEQSLTKSEVCEHSFKNIDTCV